jgi:hypothetical protein
LELVLSHILLVKISFMFLQLVSTNPVDSGSKCFWESGG